MKSYERPDVQTLQASNIVEMLGPVSCGSGLQLAPASPLDERMHRRSGPVELTRR